MTLMMNWDVRMHFLIIQDGSIVYENYNSPITKDTKLVSYSMAKSYIGLLTGMMIDRGFIQSKRRNKSLTKLG